MKRSVLSVETALYVWAFTLLLCGIAGCGPGGRATHPIKGQVRVASGDSQVLGGHSLELALETDPQVRAFAAIDPDGRFKVESLIDGVVRDGALEGRYRARVVLGDDDPEQQQRARAAISPKALSFDTSGLSIAVPSTGDVSLIIAGPAD